MATPNVLIDYLDKLTPILNLSEKNYNIDDYSVFNFKVLFFSLYISFIFKKEN